MDYFSLIMAAIQLIEKVIGDAQQTGELTPAQVVQLQDRAAQVFSSAESRTDDQVPQSEGGTQGG